MPSRPERPDSLPPDASWDAARSEWLVGTRDAEGRWHGWVDGHTERGLRRWRQHFRAGTPHGGFLRYHPNGETAREGQFDDGVLHGQVRATRCREPTPERLRACCVPDTAWRLVSVYERGRRLGEWFENEAGERLLSDGSVLPVRPATLPESAGFDESSRRWCQGERDSEQRREGRWRWWQESGTLCEEIDFRAGKRWGVARTYREDGQIERERHYVDDVLTGPALDLAAGTLFADPRVRGFRGAFADGQPAGSWTLLDSQGVALRQLDYGSACLRLELDHPLCGPGRKASEWRKLADELRARGQLGLALCVRLREAVESGDLAALRGCLQQATEPLSEQESQRRFGLLLKAGKPTFERVAAPVEEELARAVRALLEGVAPAPVLRKLAGLLLSRPAAGFDFVRAGLALAPGDSGLLSTRALLRFELGCPDQAIDELPPAVREANPWLADYRRWLFPKFDFWAVADFELPENPELPARVAQSETAIRCCFTKSAKRLLLIRRALSELVAQRGARAEDAEHWLPPDLTRASAGLREAVRDARLERYNFVEEPDIAETPASQQGATEPTDDGPLEQDGEPERICVDETLHLEELGITSLMRLARLEWTCLSWLCWAVGAECVELPKQIEPRRDYAKAVSQAFYRVFRVADTFQTGGLRSKTRGLPGVQWEGRDVDTLSVPFSGMARDEAFEVRAVLYWLGDPECRSLWQDDLRGDA